MAEATLVIEPNGGDVLRLTREIESAETDDGWRVEMRLTDEASHISAAQVVHEAAVIILGESHYPGRVTEYHPAEGRIVVEGNGPAPA